MKIFFERSESKETKPKEREIDIRDQLLELMVTEIELRRRALEPKAFKAKKEDRVTN